MRVGYFEIVDGCRAGFKANFVHRHISAVYKYCVCTAAQIRVQNVMRAEKCALISPAYAAYASPLRPNP